MSVGNCVDFPQSLKAKAGVFFFIFIFYKFGRVADIVK